LTTKGGKYVGHRGYERVKSLRGDKRHHKKGKNTKKEEGIIEKFQQAERRVSKRTIVELVKGETKRR